ncbi:MAG: site-specific integrase [Deltaproteobacteria bacterium]|nr:site-specific integrase [Deltaproteobacteria bacterium]
MAVRKDRRKGWLVDFRWTYPDGRRVRIRQVAPSNTKQSALTLERRLKNELENPTPERREAPGFAAFAEEFMETYVASNNKPSERESKECIFRNYLNPRFGNHSLETISYRDVERFKADLLGQALSPKRINNILAVLRRLLTYAVEIEILERAPKVKALKVAPTARDFLTNDEYRRLIERASEESLWGLALKVAGECGLRLGEILGLFWDDLDLVSGVLTVRRALVRGVMGSPKGGRERKIPLQADLIRELRSFKHLKGDHVFSDEAGSPLTKKMAERAIKRVCRRAGLRPIGWHCLRHTYCSHLAMAGVSPRSIQELAGHADIRTTMGYMHLAPAALNQAVAELAEFRAKENPFGHQVGTKRIIGA